MATQDEIASILQQMRELSVGDLSTWEAMIATPGKSQIGTSPDSPNNRLGAAMEKLGWVKLHNHEISAESVTIFMPSIELLEQGREPIAGLLREVRRPVNMAKIYEEFCLDFLKQLAQKVDQGGGGIQDTHMLIALTMSKLINTSVQPEYRKKALDNMFWYMKEQLKN